MCRKILIILVFIVCCLYSQAQLQGAFNYGQDGHIYFVLSNPTGYQIPVVWGVRNFETGESRQNQGVMAPYSTFYYGPNANWVWLKGEIFAITYNNGQSQHWTCPETDPSKRKKYEVPFRGSPKCNFPIGASRCYIIGDCRNKGFAEGSSLTVCKHCGHDKSWHH